MSKKLKRLFGSGKKKKKPDNKVREFDLADCTGFTEEEYVSVPLSALPPELREMAKLNEIMRKMMQGKEDFREGMSTLLETAGRGIKENPELLKALKRDILKRLKKGERTPQVITEELGCPSDWTAYTLEKLIEENKVEVRQEEKETVYFIP